MRVSIHVRVRELAHACKLGTCGRTHTHTHTHTHTSMRSMTEGYFLFSDKKYMPSGVRVILACLVAPPSLELCDGTLYGHRVYGAWREA